MLTYLCQYCGFYQKTIYRIKLCTDKCETQHMNLAKGKAITKSKNSENGV